MTRAGSLPSCAHSRALTACHHQARLDEVVAESILWPRAPAAPASLVRKSVGNESPPAPLCQTPGVDLYHANQANEPLEYAGTLTGCAPHRGGRGGVYAGEHPQLLPFSPSPSSRTTVTIPPSHSGLRRVPPR